MDPLGDLERVGGLSQRSGTGRGTHPEVQEGSGAFPKVKDGWVDPPGGLGQFRGPSRRSGMGLGDSQGGPGLVERISRRSRTGREVLRKVRNGSGGPPGGPGLVGVPSEGSGTSGEVLLKDRHG